jgi:hypothetical protein
MQTAPRSVRVEKTGARRLSAIRRVHEPPGSSQSERLSIRPNPTVDISNRPLGEVFRSLLSLKCTDAFCPVDFPNGVGLHAMSP